MRVAPTRSGDEQALGFVEADGAGGNAEFPGQVGNGEEVAVFRFGAVHFLALHLCVFGAQFFLAELADQGLGQGVLEDDFAGAFRSC